MNRRAFNLVASLTLIGNLCSSLLPQLTGKTMITKLQIGAMVVGGIGTIVTAWAGLLLHPPKLDEAEPMPVQVTNTPASPVPVEEAKT